MRCTPLLAVAVAILLLAPACGGKTPGPQSADDAIQAMKKYAKQIIAMFEDEDVQLGKNGLCATIDVNRGDIAGALAEFGEGGVRARGAAENLQDLIDDPTWGAAAYTGLCS